ncbi:MAG TPA: hypothetical protein PLY50_17165, partial [Burkholderiaceae bacterium]|nr:hypothetical protein [Burkholderiaceae bacterium]
SRDAQDDNVQTRCLPGRNHRPETTEDMQSPKEAMFDKDGQWIELESFDDFDNGLSDLIELWSSTSAAATIAIKESALAHFKQDLEAAALQWVDNKAKSRKYAAIGTELAEFEAVIGDRPLGTS